MNDLQRKHYSKISLFVEKRQNPKVWDYGEGIKNNLPKQNIVTLDSC